MATLDASLDGERTVRASDCVMLNEGRCVKCKWYRVYLCVKRSRNNQVDENAKIPHDSHTTYYANFPREDLVERLRNTQKEKRSLKAKCTYLVEN